MTGRFQSASNAECARRAWIADGHSDGASGVSIPTAIYTWDRSGTVFKNQPEPKIFVFATIEPSVAAYHWRSIPVASCTSQPDDFQLRPDPRITQAASERFFRGLGRPQGITLDRDGNLYVALPTEGAVQLVRITEQGQAEVVLIARVLWAIALQPSGRAIVATTDATLHARLGRFVAPLMGN